MPSDVFIPILIATFFSTLAGLLTVAWCQKINLWDKTILAYLGGLTAAIGGALYYFSSLEPAQMQIVSRVVGNFVLFGLFVSFIALAFYKRINVYDAFIEGAKEGFGIAIHIIPFLVAMLVGIGVFRASGAMDTLIGGIQTLVAALGLDTQFIPALPTALMKPLSGGGARGLMVDAMNTYGADSFVGRLSATFQGATDTTFYILAVYFGSVGIKKTRHSVVCGLLADLGGVVAAIALAYMMF